MIRPGLGNASGNGADPDFGHKLHGYARAGRIDVFQVVNQLRKILDRVYVMVRRRRNEPNARCRMTGRAQYSCRPCRRASWPPSPGFAPCAILIWISSALTRYSVVTPKRPLATCLIAERMESPLGKRLEALRPPPRLLQCSTGRRCGSWQSASVVCASRLKLTR